MMGERFIAGLGLASALSLAPALPATAQSMLKCKDARGQVTYSNVPCDKQGLKDAGTVADRTTVMPLGPVAKPPAPKGPAPASPKSDDAETIKPGATVQIKPVVPLMEKLLQK